MACALRVFLRACRRIESSAHGTSLAAGLRSCSSAAAANARFLAEPETQLPPRSFQVVTSRPFSSQSSTPAPHRRPSPGGPRKPFPGKTSQGARPGGERGGSALENSGRGGHVKLPSPERSATPRPHSQRPNSQRPNSQRPNSQRPTSQRPNSQRPNSQRPNSQRPHSQRPNSQRPGGRHAPQPPPVQFAVNEEIEAPEVRVCYPAAEELPKAVMPLAQALEEARKRELDVVLTVPQAQPPVVQLVEYKLFLWELSKREKAAAKALREQQRRGRPKEVRITLQASPHDRDIKIQQARGLLESGHVVRLMVMARLREMGAAQELLQELAETLGEAGAFSEGKAAFVPGKNNVACTVHPSKVRAKRPALRQARAAEVA